MKEAATVITRNIVFFGTKEACSLANLRFLGTRQKDNIPHISEPVPHESLSFCTQITPITDSTPAPTIPSSPLFIVAVDLDQQDYLQTFESHIAHLKNQHPHTPFIALTFYSESLGQHTERFTSLAEIALKLGAFRTKAHPKTQREGEKFFTFITESLVKKDATIFEELLTGTDYLQALSVYDAFSPDRHFSSDTNNNNAGTVPPAVLDLTAFPLLVARTVLHNVMRSKIDTSDYQFNKVQISLLEKQLASAFEKKRDLFFDVDARPYIIERIKKLEAQLGFYFEKSLFRNHVKCQFSPSEAKEDPRFTAIVQDTLFYEATLSEVPYGLFKELAKAILIYIRTGIRTDPTDVPATIAESTKSLLATCTASQADLVIRGIDTIFQGFKHKHSARKGINHARVQKTYQIRPNHIKEAYIAGGKGWKKHLQTHGELITHVKEKAPEEQALFCPKTPIYASCGTTPTSINASVLSESMSLQDGTTVVLASMVSKAPSTTHSVKQRNLFFSKALHRLIAGHLQEGTPIVVLKDLLPSIAERALTEVKHKCGGAPGVVIVPPEYVCFILLERKKQPTTLISMSTNNWLIGSYDADQLHTHVKGRENDREESAAPTIQVIRLKPNNIPFALHEHWRVLPLKHQIKVPESFAHYVGSLDEDKTTLDWTKVDWKKLDLTAKAEKWVLLSVPETIANASQAERIACGIPDNLLHVKTLDSGKLLGEMLPTVISDAAALGDALTLITHNRKVYAQQAEQPQHGAIFALTPSALLTRGRSPSTL